MTLARCTGRAVLSNTRTLPQGNGTQSDWPQILDRLQKPTPHILRCFTFVHVHVLNSTYTTIRQLLSWFRRHKVSTSSRRYEYRILRGGCRWSQSVAPNCAHAFPWACSSLALRCNFMLPTRESAKRGLIDLEELRGGLLQFYGSI